MISLEWLTIIGMALGVLAGAMKFAMELGKLKFMVNELWRSRRRESTAKAVDSGLGEVNSPFKLTPAGRSMFTDSMKAEFLEFYKTRCQDLTDIELQSTFECKFGERLLHDVSIPTAKDRNMRTITPDVIALAAIEVAREMYQAEQAQLKKAD